MTDAPVIQDPSTRFIEAQQEDLADFVFRLTGDRSRAGVMAREACQQMKDELESQVTDEQIRSRLFQLAYEMNEEAMRPVARSFFEAWFRHHHRDPRTVAPSYRWEMALLELGHHAAQLLLLHHRYGFTTEACAAILYRDEADIEHELQVLAELIRKDAAGLDLAWLPQLPRYGFLDIPEQQTTALSHIMQQLKPRRHWWPQIFGLLAFAMLALFFWLLHAFTGFSQLWRTLWAWMM
jgi:hypothetical protein